MTHPNYADPPLRLCLNWFATKEFHEIVKIEWTGRAVVHVSEVRLTHRRFKDTAVAYGEGVLGDKLALLVVSEDESGGEATLSLRDAPPAASTAKDEAQGYSTEDSDGLDGEAA